MAWRCPLRPSITRDTFWWFDWGLIELPVLLFGVGRTPHALPRHPPAFVQHIPCHHAHLASSQAHVGGAGGGAGGVGDRRCSSTIGGRTGHTN